VIEDAEEDGELEGEVGEGGRAGVDGEHVGQSQAADGEERDEPHEPVEGDIAQGEGEHAGDGGERRALELVPALGGHLAEGGADDPDEEGDAEGEAGDLEGDAEVISAERGRGVGGVVVGEGHGRSG
jgi:hypothetical protein